ncbi:hypothetical protein GYMLUDRAFT_128868, partial [Collybiopsis luxurians FD-317 M1]
LIQFLESVHIGEFLTGTKDDIVQAVEETEALESHISPKLSLPIPPPTSCSCGQSDCNDCLEYHRWYCNYQLTIDDLLLKSNLHDCFWAFYPDDTIKNLEKFECKARFPCELHEKSFVDPITGHLALKKFEAWLNDICRLLMYLFCCNTDVTCLLSGTAIKAIVQYVADYITKFGLKTHIVFDSIRAIFEKNSEIL